MTKKIFERIVNLGFCCRKMFEKCLFYDFIIILFLNMTCILG